MNTTLLITVTGALFALYLWMGRRASASVSENDDYFLMGRGLGFFPLFLTLLATQLGGGVLLGAAQEAYQKGWAVLAYPLGQSLGFLALGLGFGAKLRRMDISTIAEIFEKIYESRHLRWVASVISMCSLYFILVGQGVAAKSFFMSIGLENPIWFVIFWGVFVGYTVMGGLKAVVDTDIIQALFIFIGLAAAFICLDLADVMSAASWSPVTASADIPWSSWLLMPFCFMLIEQDMGQRCFAAKTPSIIRPAAITSGFVLFACSSVAIIFGVMASKMGLVAPEGSSILITAMTTLTNPFVASLFMGVVVMAIASTADSLLCSIGSHLSCDFLALRPMKDKTQLTLSRILTFAVGLSALFLVYMFDSVVSVLILSYELSVSALLVPVVMAVLSKKPSKTGAFLAVMSGIGGFILFRAISPLPLPKELLTLAASALGYGVGMCIKRR